MAGRIFVNYRRDDAASQALNVAQYLEATFGKRNVFLDIDRMRAGQSFPAVLKERLSASKVMLAIIGPSWLDVKGEDGRRRLDDPADWVRLEIATALTSGTVVIPVLVGGASLPRKGQLPPDLQALTDQHAVTVTTNGFRHEMAGLARDIRAIPGPLPWGMIGGGTAAALALVLGGWAAAYQLGVPVWAPSIWGLTPGRNVAADRASLGQGSDPNRTIADAKAATDKAQAERDAKLIADAEARIRGEIEAKRKADEDAIRRDPALSVTPGSRQSFRDRLANGQPCAFCPDMVVVPAGSLTMGSPQSEEGRRSDEGPQRRVSFVRPFAVGKFEVTFEEWDACVADGGCKHKPETNWGRGKQPVHSVSWDDITKEYLPWLNRRTGKSYRLLTEAEWEYAARAATQTPFWWGNTISTRQANYDGNYVYAKGATGEYRQRTVPVDSFEANAWGLFNVHGNVWEWVEDCYADSYNGAPTDGSSVKETPSCRRVLRGGSWYDIPVNLRSAYRFRNPSDFRNYFLGFRLGRTF